MQESCSMKSAVNSLSHNIYLSFSKKLRMDLTVFQSRGLWT